MWVRRSCVPSKENALTPSTLSRAELVAELLAPQPTYSAISTPRVDDSEPRYGSRGDRSADDGGRVITARARLSMRLGHYRGRVDH